LRASDCNYSILPRLYVTLFTVKRYLRTVLVDEEDTDERLSAQIARRTLGNIDVSGAHIINSDLSSVLEDGCTIVYSLSRIGFDSVAQSMYEETRGVVRELQPDAEVAFDELSDMLAEQQEGDSADGHWDEPWGDD